MAITLTPSMRYMLLCDGVVKGVSHPGELTIACLTTFVIWPAPQKEYVVC